MGEVSNRNCTCCLPLYRLGLCYSRRQLLAKADIARLCVDVLAIMRAAAASETSAVTYRP
jgi:hypothetical protein